MQLYCGRHDASSVLFAPAGWNVDAHMNEKSEKG